MIPSGTVDDWCARSWHEYRTGKVERALSGFRHALALDPSSFAARFGLSSVLLDVGDVSGSATMIESMVAIHGGRPEVLWLRARIAMARDDAHKACGAIEQLLATNGLDGVQRAEALLLKGLALGDIGQSGPAFSVACEGKRILRAAFASQAASREDEVTKLRRLDRWIAQMPTTASPVSREPSPIAAAQHVFLLGFPRSGTTLLEQVLAAHSRVSTLEEAPTLSTLYQAFLSDTKACASLDHLQSDEAAAWVHHYWELVHRYGGQAAGRVFVDKQPAGTLHLPVIARLFPTAKILFALRDPRDVVLSCFRQAFQMNAMTYAFTDFSETASCYDACMTLARTARAHFSLDWTNVRHEALIEDFDAELARILGFLELDDEPAMRDFARIANTRPIRTPSARQVRAGLNRRGLGRWRQYGRELAPILPILEPWIDRFGYAT